MTLARALGSLYSPAKPNIRFFAQGSCLIFSKLIAFSHCGKFDSFHQDLDSTTDHWGTNVSTPK